MSRVSAGKVYPTCRCGAPTKLRKGQYGQFFGCSTFPKCRETSSYKKWLAEQEPEPLTEFNPSHYQIAFRVEVENGTGHIVLKAGPGSGKTVTGVWVTVFIPRDLKVGFLAFNKKIAVEFGGKLPRHIHSSTVHSIGLSDVRNVFPKVKVEPRKVYYIIRDLMDRMPFEEAEIVRENIGTIQTLVSLCKGLLLDPTPDSFNYIVDRWNNVQVNGDAELIYDVAAETFRLSVEQDTTIDFDDMVYYPVIDKVPCEQFDMLIIDETQDLNKANLEFVVKSIKPGGRIIAIGDPHQSIYGFRGADTQAMPRIIERLDAKVLPLSISYRLPKSGVELANIIFPGLEAAPDAKDGIIENVTYYEFYRKVKPGDLVLCRTNAPLVKPAFSLIRQGVKAVILGRDIGKNVMGLVKKVQKRYRVASLDDTLGALDEYARKECARLLKREKDMAADLLMDKIETVHALADGCYTVGDLERRVETVFADDAAGVVFSTVHKAKGGEADNVFILRSDLMPHPKATADWELEQEHNIQYVCWTRHKKALYFVGGGAPFTADGEADEASLEPLREELLAKPEVRKVAEAAAEIASPDAIRTIIETTTNLLDRFPAEGKFERNIYRPSAHDFVLAMPDWTPEIDTGQLVMSKELSDDSTLKVYTSVKTGKIAGGTGSDSIRVVRLDVRKKDGRIFPFKHGQDWVTREVPKDKKTSEAATAHLVGKIERQLEKMTKTCPDCGKTAVKCSRGKTGLWWRCLECRWSTW